MREDVGASFKWLKQLLCNQQRTNRSVCRGHALGKNQHVRLEVVPLRGEHGSGTSEAVDGLVGNNQNVVLVADLTNAIEVNLRRCETSTRVLNRLEDKRRNGVWIFEQNHLFYAVCGPKSEFLFGGKVVLSAVPVSVWHSKGARNQRFKHLLHGWNASKRKGSVRCAVVGHCAGKHLVLGWLANHFEILLGQLPGGLVSFATTGGEENAAQVLRRIREQALRKFDTRLVCV